VQAGETVGFLQYARRAGSSHRYVGARSTTGWKDENQQKSVDPSDEQVLARPHTSGTYSLSATLGA